MSETDTERQYHQLSSRLHCRGRRRMAWRNSRIYFPSHLCAADPLRLIFLSLLVLRLLFMLYNVDKSHYGVCVSTGGSCIDYGDWQRKGPADPCPLFALYLCSKLSTQLGSSSSPSCNSGRQRGVNKDMGRLMKCEEGAARQSTAVYKGRGVVGNKQKG